MKSDKVPYKATVFICTTEKLGSCCGAKGSGDLRDRLKKICRERYGKQVRVMSTTCMGQCDLGMNVFLYPDGEWLSQVKAEDFESILAKVEGAVNL